MTFDEIKNLDVPALYTQKSINHKKMFATLTKISYFNPLYMIDNQTT
jgi:hypothetical protein